MQIRTTIRHPVPVKIACIKNIDTCAAKEVVRNGLSFTPVRLLPGPTPMDQSVENSSNLRSKLLYAICYVTQNSHFQGLSHD